MSVLLASAKKMVVHHAFHKQESRDGQDHYEQKLGKPKPRWVLFFRVYIVPVRGHESFPRRQSLALGCGLYDPPFVRPRQTPRRIL